MHSKKKLMAAIFFRSFPIHVLTYMGICPYKGA